MSLMAYLHLINHHPLISEQSYHSYVIL